MMKKFTSFLYLFFLFIFLISCNAEEKGSTDSTTKETGFSFVSNTLEMELSTHIENTQYNSGTIYFDMIAGSISAENYSGFLSVKWESSTNGLVNFSGNGGLTNSIWNDGNFSGDWSILNLRLQNGAINKVKVIIKDAIGNETSKSFNVNCFIAAPELEIVDPAVAFLWTNQPNYIVEGTLNSSVQVDLFNWNNSLNLESGSLAIIADWSKNIILSDGENELTFSVTDVVGNITKKTVTVGYDFTSPIVAMTLPNTTNSFVTSSTALANIGGTAADPQSGLSSLSWINSANGEFGIPAGLFSWSISGIPVVDGHNPITISAVDNVGVINNFLFTYTVDRTPAIFTGSSFLINNGATSTVSSSIGIDISIVDSLSKIMEVCFKYNNILTPTSGDSCWSSVPVPARNVTLDDFPFSLGATSMPYNIYAWAKDEVGNISTLSNGGGGTPGQDLASINYIPGPSAQISNFIGTGVDNGSNPPTTIEAQVTVGADLFIKWKITDDQIIPSGAIDLFYTTDDVVYTSIISGVNNLANTGCTIDANFTGCYKWNSGVPTNTYLKLRIVVKDASEMVSLASSNALNSGSLNFITGNTDLGLNGSAVNSILFNDGEAVYNDKGDPGALVVTTTGYVFLRDEYRGLLYIDPSDGIIKQLIAQTGTYAGDGGPANNATFQNFAYLALDFNDRLLIWDGSRVRRIDLSTTPWSIELVFGGGADSSDGAAALSASLPYRGTNNMILTPTPNGRIYFNKTYHDVWYYDSGTNTVHKHADLTGIGTDDMAGLEANYNNALCSLSHLGISFDPITSNLTSIVSQARRSSEAHCGGGSNSSSWSTNFNVVTGIAELPHPDGADSWSAHKYTGMDGKLYLMEHGRDQLNYYNLGTHYWDHIMGKVGKPGRCIDGTPMADCNMKMMSLFVNKDGQIYFTDMGVVRYVDGSGKVQTLAGQPRNFGVGASPLSARYAKIAYFDVFGTDLYVKDALEQQLVKIPLTGGNVELIAGNTINTAPTDGSNSLISPISNCKWALSCGFQINNSGNKLYHTVGYRVYYLDLTTFIWHDTGVANNAQSLFNGISASGEFLVYDNVHGGSLGDITRLFLYDPALDTRTKIFGSDLKEKNSAALICNDGSVGTDCVIGYSHSDSIAGQYKHDSVSDNWMIYKRGTKTIHEMPHGGGVVTLLTTTANNIYAFDHRRVGADRVIYYCADNGKIYKKNLTTTTETEIPIGIDSIKCSGSSIHYDLTRDSLMFIYTQNHLSGIAELTNPGS